VPRSTRRYGGITRNLGASEMIVAVAERRNAGDLTASEVAALRTLWDEYPLSSMLEARVPEGRFGAELFSLLGGRLPWGVLDLLPPDNRPGTWQQDTARSNAFRIAQWAPDHGAALLLLGRRVAGAFYFPMWAPLGEEGYLNTGAPYLLLPHPSGRNRWLNSPTHRRQVERWVRTFWAFHGENVE
jgi:hypothetical protein